MNNVLKDKDPVFQLAKLMSIKDNLLGQVFFSVMYRKAMLWDDLDIGAKEGDEVFGQPMECKVVEKIDYYQKEYNHKPTSFFYEPITENQPGIYTMPSEANDRQFTPTTAVTLKEMISGYIEMETLIKQKFLFSEEKRRQFFESNPVQQTLRKTVEDLHETIDLKNKEINALKEQLYKKDSNSHEMDDQSSKILKLEQQKTELKSEIDELLRQKKERESKISEINRKYKQEKEAAHALRAVYQPKLKETQAYQKELYEQYKLVREDTELLPDMFRQESEEKRLL